MYSLADFLAELNEISWFHSSGTVTGRYRMASSVLEAYDECNQQLLSVWEPNIYLLEKIAIEKIGDAQIDEIFTVIAHTIGHSLRENWSEFLKRQHWENQVGLDNEILDMAKRDIAWACIERILNLNGFFTALFEIYQEGFFPCAWAGPYPEGCAIVL